MEEKAQVAIHVGGQVVVADLPKIFAATAAALPLVVNLFGETKCNSVLADKLHKQVGGTYKKGAWIKRQIEDCRLVKDQDYIEVVLDVNDPANASAVARNRGEAPILTYFSAKAAAKIVSRSNSDDAHLIFDYMYYVTDAATPTLVRMYEEREAQLKAEIEGEKRIAAKAWDNASILAKGTGTSQTVAVSYITQINDLKAEIKHLHEQRDPEHARYLRNMLDVATSFAEDLKKAKSLERVQSILPKFVRTVEDFRDGRCEARSYF